MPLLADVVSDINQSRKTGLLSITIRSDNNQFKMFFRDGEVYHITCGNWKNADCITNGMNLDFSGCFFVPNVKLDAVNANLPSTIVLVEILRAKGISVDIKQPDGKVQQAPGSAPAVPDFPRIREELKTALIRQIGPAGGKILSKIIDEKWKVASPSRPDLAGLVDLLKAEIEDGENRTAFTDEAEKIIS